MATPTLNSWLLQLNVLLSFLVLQDVKSFVKTSIPFNLFNLFCVFLFFFLFFFFLKTKFYLLSVITQFVLPILAFTYICWVFHGDISPCVFLVLGVLSSYYKDTRSNQIKVIDEKNIVFHLTHSSALSVSKTS